jgi:hypothetical protein
MKSRIHRILNTASMTGATLIMLAAGETAHGQVGESRPGSTEELCATRCPAPGPEGFYSTNAWPDGNVYYRFDATTTPTQQQQMLDALDAISAVVNVQFIPWSSQGNWITILPDSSSYSSHIGMKQPMGSGEQTVGIAPHSWSLPGIMMHEMMHALGLRHEHQRVDRVGYIQVDPAAPNTVGAYMILPNPPYNANPLGDYDFASLMHYAQSFFSFDDRAITVLEPYRRDWQWRIGAGSFAPQPSLSNGDRWALYHLYPGPIAPPPRAFELLAPANAALVGDAWVPEFTWEASEAAESYRVQVDDSPAFDSPEFSVDLPRTQTSYTHSRPLSAQRLYWWRVTASNAAGETESYFLASQTFYTASAFPGSLFVDDSAPAGGTGLAWNTALQNLGMAMEIGRASDGVVTEIRVAAGTYTPDFGSGDRTRSFDLPGGSEVRGGYAGYGAPDPDARDIEANQTVLSGDLSDDDGPGFTNIGDNALHVVRAVDRPSPLLLEGFTIRGGKGEREAWAGAMGGGALVDAPVTFRRCTFTSNHSDDNGGAVAVFLQGATPRFEECVFRGNRTGLTSPVTTRVYGGGAVFMFKAAGEFIGCVFEDNAAHAGGAVSVAFNQPRFVNCLFVGNDATASTGVYFGGGALLGTHGAQATLVNCTLVGNTSAAAGGAVRSNGIASAAISNSILWSNTPDQTTGTTTMASSNVEGGMPPGPGNISQAPAWAGSGAHAFALAAGSPGIDAGSNAAVPAGTITDLVGNPRFIDDPCTTDTGLGPAPIVDMGAYEYRLYPDCNLDGVLTVADFGCFQTKFVAGDPYADCNGDGLRTVADFGCFQTKFVAGCP